MKEAYIKAISYYLPSKRLDNSDLNKLFPEWSADKISSKTGIFSRRLVEKNESTSDLACEAALNLFNEYAVQPTDIDFVLLCTQSPDYFLPTTACVLQNRLGVPTSAGALDFNLGCSGYIYGLSLAKGLITAGIAKNVLLVTSETYSKFIHSQDKGNLSLFGDGASATLIGLNEGLARIGEFELGTDGRGAENLIVKNGATKYPNKNGDDILDSSGSFLKNDDNLYMNGSEIFQFTSEAVPKMVNNQLEKELLAKDEVDLYIFHQANQFMLNHIRKKIGIPEDKFYIFLRDCGNTVSSTIPIALKEAMKEGKIQNDDKVLLAGFGVGYSWGSTVIYFKG